MRKPDGIIVDGELLVLPKRVIGMVRLRGAATCVSAHALNGINNCRVVLRGVWEQCALRGAATVCVSAHALNGINNCRVVLQGVWEQCRAQPDEKPTLVAQEATAVQ